MTGIKRNVREIVDAIEAAGFELIHLQTVGLVIISCTSQTCINKINRLQSNYSLSAVNHKYSLGDVTTYHGRSIKACNSIVV